MRGVSCWVFLLVTVVVSKKLKKTFDSEGQWKYIDKFCFGSDGGQIQMYMSADTTNPLLRHQAISVYPGAVWKEVYESDMNCFDRLKKAKAVIPLEKAGVPTGNFAFKIAYSNPNWWYFAVSNCKFTAENGTSFEDPPQFDINYNPNYIKTDIWMNFTNNGEPVYSKAEFGADEWGIYEMSISFFCAYSCLIGFMFYIKREAKRQQMQYQIVKRLGITCVFFAIASLTRLIRMAEYSMDGYASVNYDGFEAFFLIIAELFMLGVMLDLAKGLYISTNFVGGRRAAYGAMFLLFVLYVILHMFGTQRDQASTLYVYNSTPGWMVIIARIATFVWFAYLLYQTWQEEFEQSKRSWYTNFGFMATFWMLSDPITVCIGLSIESYARAKVVYMCSHMFHLISITLIALLFSPFSWNCFTVVLRPDEAGSQGFKNTGQIFPQAIPDGLRDPMADFDSRKFDNVNDEASNEFYEEEDDEPKQKSRRNSERRGSNNDRGSRRGSADDTNNNDKFNNDNYDDE